MRINYSLIPPSIQDRVGLGRQRFLQERKVLKRAEEVRSVDSFRQRKLEKFSLRQIETDIRRSQLACEQLDSNMVSLMVA